jgi:hypothetical protein
MSFPTATTAEQLTPPSKNRLRAVNFGGLRGVRRDERDGVCRLRLDLDLVFVNHDAVDQELQVRLRHRRVVRDEDVLDAVLEPLDGGFRGGFGRGWASPRCFTRGPAI